MHDLESYNFGAGSASGGRLKNQCCTTGCTFTWNDAGTNEDWMRFFWDWYTNSNSSCSSQPSGRDMLNLYSQTRLSSGLTARNYQTKMRTAATQIGLPSCLATTRFDAYYNHNGINS